MSRFEEPDLTPHALPTQATLTRLVFDLRSGRAMHGRGHAVWEPSGRMTETILFDGREASRVTLWRFTDDGGLAIDYEDGAPLVAFAQPFRRSESVHHCAPDLYKARLKWDVGLITLGWRVTGPTKDYAMVTHYRWEETQR